MDSWSIVWPHLVYILSCWISYDCGQVNGGRGFVNDTSNIHSGSDCGGRMWAVATENVRVSGRREVLPTGRECWDGASVSLTQFWNAFVQWTSSTHLPPLTRPPSLSPSPINDPFVWVFSHFMGPAWVRSGPQHHETLLLLQPFPLTLHH